MILAKQLSRFGTWHTQGGEQKEKWPNHTIAPNVTFTHIPLPKARHMAEPVCPSPGRHGGYLAVGRDIDISYGEQAVTNLEQGRKLSQAELWCRFTPALPTNLVWSQYMLSNFKNLWCLWRKKDPQIGHKNVAEAVEVTQECRKKTGRWG